MDCSFVRQVCLYVHKFTLCRRTLGPPLYCVLPSPLKMTAIAITARWLSVLNIKISSLNNSVHYLTKILEDKMQTAFSFSSSGLSTAPSWSHKLLVLIPCLCPMSLHHQGHQFLLSLDLSVFLHLDCSPDSTSHCHSFQICSPL